jgi:hypothetical protein
MGAHALNFQLYNHRKIKEKNFQSTLQGGIIRFRPSKDSDSPPKNYQGASDTIFHLFIIVTVSVVTKKISQVRWPVKEEAWETKSVDQSTPLAAFFFFERKHATGPSCPWPMPQVQNRPKPNKEFHPTKHFSHKRPTAHTSTSRIHSKKKIQKNTRRAAAHHGEWKKIRGIWSALLKFNGYGSTFVLFSNYC